MMNPFDAGQANRDGEAVLECLDAEFTIVKPGRYVRCAVTGVKIPFDSLKYWNVDRRYVSTEGHPA